MAGISKQFTLLVVVALLFSASFTQSARTLPTDAKAHVVDFTDATPGELDESCEGIGEDECLVRRTLIAHTDYIYTQKKGHH